MSPERVYLDYLKDVLDGLQKAHVFVADPNHEEFAKDEKTIFAVVRALEIVGEAAKIHRSSRCSLPAPAPAK